MSELENNLKNRNWLVERLRAEIIGPDPSGKEIEFKDNGQKLFSWKEFGEPKKQSNGEEIIWQDSPVKRYGAGVLYPIGLTESLQTAEEANSTPEDIPEEGPGEDIRIDEDMEKKAEKVAPKTGIGSDISDEYDVSLANSYRPSAMGVSFLADFNHETEGITVTPSFAFYTKKKVFVGESLKKGKFSEREFWLRVPSEALLDSDVGPEIFFPASDLTSQTKCRRDWVPGFDGKVEIVIVSRPLTGGSEKNKRLLTVSMINRQEKDAGRVDERCLFQCWFRIKGVSGIPWIPPYPETVRENRKPGDEEEILKLLYRDRMTFAIGHGCAADWPADRPLGIDEIWTDSFPLFETPSIIADLKDKDENPLRVSMRKLGGLDSDDDGMEEIENLISAYQEWIKDLEEVGKREPPVPKGLENTAQILVERCRECKERIAAGLNFLRKEKTAQGSVWKSFRLANHAMLIAQLRSSREVRNPSWKDGLMTWDKPISNPDPSVPDRDRGYWRAFQIAFLIMTIPGICDPEHQDREIVDLIWFPTGGGKTEAYLGLTAFTVFYNQLEGKNSAGVDVLMRYTLRLLTAQQFQRASELFCAMEFLRRKMRSGLGENPFKLGMWVGGGATPNKCKDGVIALRKLQRNPESENPFVLLKCPWCGARFGPYSNSDSGRGRRRRVNRSAEQIYGYSEFRRPGRGADTVVFRCNDPECEFGSHPAKPRAPLPIVVIDEDIYNSPPNLLIGTVDKFAMLAWKPEARAIFGIGAAGTHTGIPPSLIIQDELHLISGPLGSMVGAYETVIHELCTLRDAGSQIKPKIVASTATISRAQDQIRSLYAREKVMLFPPSGLEARDSFFSREDINEDGSYNPGRLYVGIMAPGHGSQQTTISRVFASLLQYPAVMPVTESEEAERDPWWTLLCFFNSLRELGGAATLLVSDARDYLRVILNRHGQPYANIRQLLNIIELTSRIRSDRIPSAINKLEYPFKRNRKGYVRDTVEVCLASNIIEVGIDIDRLSLMAIVGQPKTNSQYIQVSSRIGRKSSSPGLVTVLLSPSKPRDRSHYEKFRTFHSRLYAQVEPTSVTPFSPPAVDRALHGIITAAVRQTGDQSIASSPRPFPLKRETTLRKKIIDMLISRVETVDKDEKRNVQKILSRRFREWETWDPKDYGKFGPQEEDPPLLHPAGAQQPPIWAGRSWATLSSLRDVDAACEAEITGAYNELMEEILL